MNKKSCELADFVLENVPNSVRVIKENAAEFLAKCNSQQLRQKYMKFGVGTPQ